MKKEVHRDYVREFFDKHSVPLINTALGRQLIEAFVADLRATTGCEPERIMVYLGPRNRVAQEPFTVEELRKICETEPNPKTKRLDKPDASKFAEPLF